VMEPVLSARIVSYKVSLLRRAPPRPYSREAPQL
jgi:hypothetical protein